MHLEIQNSHCKQMLRLSLSRISGLAEAKLMLEYLGITCWLRKFQLLSERKKKLETK